MLDNYEVDRFGVIHRIDATPIKYDRQYISYYAGRLVTCLVPGEPLAAENRGPPKRYCATPGLTSSRNIASNVMLLHIV